MKLKPDDRFGMQDDHFHVIAASASVVLCQRRYDGLYLAVGGGAVRDRGDVYDKQLDTVSSHFSNLRSGW